MRKMTRWTPALLMMLAACAVSPPEAPRHRAGAGVVESASVVSLPSSSAAGGGTASPTMAYRIGMVDGSTQSVVQSGERFQVGERVQVTSDGRLARP
jgi:hypothetical protein